MGASRVRRTAAWLGVGLAFAALLVMLSVGYAPRTPSALILTVVAVALMARSTIALSRGDSP